MNSWDRVMEKRRNGVVGGRVSTFVCAGCGGAMDEPSCRPCGELRAEQVRRLVDEALDMQDGYRNEPGTSATARP
jgi:hypothetical protein